MQDIPQILIDVPPEKFRELLELLLGGPLQHQSSSIGHEVIDSPTDEHKAQPHVTLAGGKIMLRNERSELLFRTAWHSSRQLRRDDDLDMTRIMYMGAAADGRFLHKGSEMKCKDRWSELRSSVQPAESTGPEWPEVKNAVKIGWKILGIGKFIEWFTD